MSFNDLTPELRDKVRKSIDISDDMEFAAGVLLDVVDEQTVHEKSLTSTLEEIFKNSGLRFDVAAADVYVVDEK